MRVRLICLVAFQRVSELEQSQQPFSFCDKRSCWCTKMSAPDAEEAREEPLTADSIRALIREELAAARAGPPLTAEESPPVPAGDAAPPHSGEQPHGITVCRLHGGNLRRAKALPSRASPHMAATPVLSSQARHPSPWPRCHYCHQRRG